MHRDRLGAHQQNTSAKSVQPQNRKVSVLLQHYTQHSSPQLCAGNLATPHMQLELTLPTISCLAASSLHCRSVSSTWFRSDSTAAVNSVNCRWNFSGDCGTRSAAAAAEQQQFNGMGFCSDATVCVHKVGAFGWGPGESEDQQASCSAR